jgi:hypothetical protein
VQWLLTATAGRFWEVQISQVQTHKSTALSLLNELMQESQKLASTEKSYAGTLGQHRLIASLTTHQHESALLTKVNKCAWRRYG